MRRSVASRELSASIGRTVFIAWGRWSQMSSHVAGTRAAARSIPSHFDLSMPGMRVTGHWSPLSDGRRSAAAERATPHGGGENP